MQQITFEVTDKSKLEALKAYAATLGEINIIEEEEEVFYPFSKEESERRLEESRKQIREGNSFTVEEVQLEMRKRIEQRYHGI